MCGPDLFLRPWKVCLTVLLSCWMDSGLSFVKPLQLHQCNMLDIAEVCKTNLYYKLVLNVRETKYVMSYKKLCMIFIASQNYIQTVTWSNTSSFDVAKYN